MAEIKWTATDCDTTTGTIDISAEVASEYFLRTTELDTIN